MRQIKQMLYEDVVLKNKDEEFDEQSLKTGIQAYLDYYQIEQHLAPYVNKPAVYQKLLEKKVNHFNHLTNRALLFYFINFKMIINLQDLQAKINYYRINHILIDQEEAKELYQNALKEAAGCQNLYLADRVIEDLLEKINVDLKTVTKES